MNRKRTDILKNPNTRSLDSNNKTILPKPQNKLKINSPFNEYFSNNIHPVDKKENRQKTYSYTQRSTSDGDEYANMQLKLEQIENKIEELKASIYKKNTEREKKNTERAKILSEVKKLFEIKNKNEKNPSDLNAKQKLSISSKPLEKSSSFLKQKTLKESEYIQSKEEKTPNLNEFITQQPMHLSLNGLVTSVPENKSHSFDTNPYSPRSNIYYVSEVIKGYSDMKSIVYDHIKTSIFLFNYFSHMRMPSNIEVQKRAVNLAVSKGYEDKKTIIFDLDETLIHCNENIKMEHEVEIEITFPNGDLINAGINIRPGVVDILEKLYQRFELIVFTASHKCYANVVVDLLDPERKYFKHRLYREHCHLTPNGEYVKDLRIINRELKNMVLVDNAAYSYAFQPENGIPIIPYYHGKNDFELKMLTNYIEKLEFSSDLRTENRKSFRLNRYRNYKPKDVEALVEDLYINNIE